MDDFFVGFKNWWDTQSSNAFYTGIGGRLRNNFARQNEEYPFCVFTNVDGLPEFFQDDNYDELYHIEIQLDIYSESNSVTLDLSKKCMALFDNATFSISGWSILKFERTRNFLVPDLRDVFEEQSEFDFMTHRYFITYDIILQKARA